MEEKVKLDLKDRKLLFALDFHARTPNSVLAKKIGLSKQGVDNKIRNLMKKGVITGFYPLINLTKLGAIYGRIFLRTQNLTKEKQQEIHDFLNNDPRFKWVIIGEGNYDLFFGVWTKSLAEFKNILDEVVSKYSFYIKENKESILIKLTHFQNRFFLDTTETEEIIMLGEDEKISVDETDKTILMELTKNARIPMAEISRRINVPRKVVAYRIKRMEENKIILGYRPSVNNNLLGYTQYKILFHFANATEQEVKKLKQYLKELPEVIYFVEELGMCDLDIEIMLKSTQDFFNFMNNIKYQFPTLIKEYETLIFVNTLKINYLPF